MSDQDRPNVLFIVLDTVRAQQLGIYGREINPMPHLSTFSEDATVFDRAYSNSPWTLPSHASLFTGKLPSEHKCDGNSPRLTEDHKTLAEQFSSSGYNTLGISNNIWVSDHFGLSRGFDTFFKQWQFFREARDVAHVLKSSDLDGFLSEFLAGNPLVNLINGIYGKYFYRRNDFGGKRTTIDAIKQIKKLSERDQPWFCFLNYMEAHAPYLEHPSTSQFLPENEEDISYYTELSGRSADYHTGHETVEDSEFEILEALYDGELRYLDKLLGNLFDQLEHEAIIDKTIVVVVGDHGENIGDHGLMAHRFSIHDTLTHIPLIIKTPTDYPSVPAPGHPVDLRAVHNALITIALEENYTMQVEETVPIIEYLDTSYTPEAQDSDFDFECSPYDRRFVGRVNSDHKIVADDEGEVHVYEFDGDDYDTNQSPSRPTDEEVEQIRPYTAVFSSLQTEGPDIEDSNVREHLQDLGYL